ncbi:DUF58 domain-containing protein [Cellvibrio sp. QJXJ]|uniref:DUF58 domain-containing protein n=1 Tax=Cellvibrio sp. QJXJ TaxID=2964606 RepID=UPI0021C36D74|nr:DUF58 domain-containing protein [Cellvibrio sp. QJXJ]UUA74777.1 DUF58 domain-containing protein [Cellvibrio sp. QJXJ]
MRRKWIPSSRLITAFALLGAAVFINAFSKSYFNTGLADYLPAAMFGGLIIIALLDFMLSRRLPPVEITREVAGNLAVDKWAPVTLRIKHRFTQPTQIKIFDGVPNSADHDNLPLTIELQPNHNSRNEYQLRPLVRGAEQIKQAQVEFYSPLGFWAIRYWTGDATPIKVYPDFVAIANYAILATENHTSQMGIKKRQRRGEGMEFHQLREYRQGDSLRQLDWKATARRQKLMARDYQDERDQQIVLMIDSGRRMRAKDDELSHFDHALNAMLLVSYIALRQGDNVSLLSFGSEGNKKHRWIPPQKGVERVKTLLNGIYDLQATQATADYITAAEKLAILQPKRSLVILVTNSRDEDNNELLLAVNLLKKRHLVMVVNIREHILDKLADTPVRDFDDALHYAGVQQFLHERSESHQQLTSSGIYAIDCTANELAVRVANAYWEIKGAGVL